MNDLIGREATISDIRIKYCAECNNYNGVRCRACWVDDMIDEIDRASAVDTEPVRHGRWITESIPQEGYNTFCSHCKRLLHNAPFIAYNYCPHCGAKMDGGM